VFVVVLLLLLLAIVRGFLSNHLSISPTVSHSWLIVPDFLFVAVASFWIFFKRKLTVSWPLVIFLLSFAGSLFWDYQDGFRFLKILFPVILFAYLNRKKLESTSVKAIGKFFLPLAIFPPYFVYKVVRDLPRKAAYVLPVTRKNSYRSVVVGVVVGLLMVLLLAGLDEGFAAFLRIDQWWELIGRVFYSLFYYASVFLVFFWVPIRAHWDPEKFSPILQRFVQAAIVIILSIVVGYTFYNIYIVLRAFKLVDFKFEGMGNNTQMEYLELVVLGGGWLFCVTYVLDKLLFHYETATSRVKVLTGALFASLAWLLPPVLNIVRVLLDVYIPAFGLTARRLFGVYTVVAFLVAMVSVGVVYFKKRPNFFVGVFFSFGLTLIFFSFALPNNLIMANWHFSRYLEGKEVDFDYVSKLRLGKWGWQFISKLNPGKYPSDNVWGWLFAGKSWRKDQEKQFFDNIILSVDRDVRAVMSLVTAQGFSKLARNYGNDDLWFYRGEPITKLTIVSKGDVAGFADTYQEQVGDFSFYDRNDFWGGESILSSHRLRIDLPVEYRWQRARSQEAGDFRFREFLEMPNVQWEGKSLYRTEKTLSLILNTSRGIKSFLRVGDGLEPFLVKNFDEMCQPDELEIYPSVGVDVACSLGGVCWQLKEDGQPIILGYPAIPGDLVEKYLVNLFESDHCRFLLN